MFHLTQKVANIHVTMNRRAAVNFRQGVQSQVQCLLLAFKWTSRQSVKWVTDFALKKTSVNSRFKSIFSCSSSPSESSGGREVLPMTLSEVDVVSGRSGASDVVSAAL